MLHIFSLVTFFGVEHFVYKGFISVLSHSSNPSRLHKQHLFVFVLVHTFN